MTNKRKFVGITLFGVICLLMPLPQLLSYAVLVLPNLPNALKQPLIGFILSRLVPIFLCLLLLHTAVGIFKLKEWARQFAIFFSYVWAISNIMNIVSLYNNDLLGKNFYATPVIRVGIYVIIMVGIIVPLFYVWYFNKPEIKEQFQ